VFANLDSSINNKGQVLGEAGSNGFTVRFPVLWTNGVPQALPIPSGYSYIAVLSTYHVNDAGTVIGTVQEATSTRGHIVVWNSGAPTVLPDAPVPGACSGAGCICTTLGSSTSYGLNTAGHILGSTSYASLTPGGPACAALWVYNGLTYRLLPYATFAGCAPNTTSAAAVGINDADQVLENVQNFFCTGKPAIQGAIVQPNGSYSLVPLSVSGVTNLNNLGQVMGFTDNGGVDDVVFYDGANDYDFGPSGYNSLNNLGQIAYRATSPGLLEVWENGVSTPITTSPSIAGLGTGATAGFNDAGQIAVQVPGVGGFLLSPVGACAQDVTGQVAVTRGGFRLNRTTMHFTQSITVTNTGADTIVGPISIALDNVPSAASLFGISGATLCDTPQGSPFLTSPASSLAAGASTSVTLEFIDSASAGITYSTRVLAGPGGR
jgi:uncharacterized membrane protein